MNWRYLLYGLRIDSQIELDATPLEDGDVDTCDVTIVRGSIHPALQDARQYNARNWIGPQGVLLHVPGDARILVSEGQKIILEAKSEEGMAAFLGASAMAAILHQRGIVCLHASAVQTKYGAVLFSAPSGFGKSTAALAMSQSGYQIITDDIAALTAGADGEWSLAPGPARIKLWPDVLHSAGISAQNLQLVLPHIEKRYLPTRFAPPSHTPVAAIFFLDTESSEEIPVRLGADMTMSLLLGNQFRKRMQAAIDPQHAILPKLMSLAQKVPCFRLTRGSTEVHLESTVKKIEHTLEAQQSHDLVAGLLS